MSLIIPNAKQATDGFKFKSLDQSEPDSLDFEILGDSGNGVLEGCEVRRGEGNFGLTVSPGRVLVKGAHYDVAATTDVTVGSPMSTTGNKQYALVVVEIGPEGNADIKVIADPENVGTNPTFPASVNIEDTGLIHLDHHVVLASVLLVGSSVPDDTNIVDKRAMRNTTNVSIVKDGAPANTEAAPGQLYFDSSAQRGDESGLYVKTRTGSGSADAWKELAVAKQVELPIGAVFAWPSATPPSDTDRFLPANGQTVPRESYPALATAYGELGLSFKLPDLNDGYMLKGTKTTTKAGSSVGSDTVSITNSNLPPHTHGVKEHSHDMKHTHDVSHNHGAKHTHRVQNHYHNFSASLSNTHSHDVGTHYHSMDHGHTASMNTAGAHDHWIDTQVQSNGMDIAWLWGLQPSGDLSTPGDWTAAKQSLHRAASGGTAGDALSTRSFVFTPDGGHKHTVSVLKHTGNTDHPVDSGGGNNTNTGDKKIGFEIDNLTGSPVAKDGSVPASETGESLTTTDNHTGDTGASSASNTGNVSATTDVNTTTTDPLDIVPKARLVVWYVRVS